MREPLRGQTEDRNVREGDGGEGDEGVAEEIPRRDPLATQQRRRHGVREHGLHRLAEAAHARGDHRHGDRAKQQEQRGLERVDQRGAAHAAEEDVAHDDERDHGAAEPVGHKAIADGAERGAAAHDGDDDVGDEQDGMHDEDHRADVAALPAVAKNLDRRHEAVPPAERPQPGADEEEADRDDQGRRGGHQPKGDDPVGERMSGGPENREGRHVRADQRQQKDRRTQRAAGEEIPLRVALLLRPAPGDADEEDEEEIREDDGG